MEDLRINDQLVIPAGELDERFSTSGGPGGQHANRAASRVTLAFDITASVALSDAQRSRLIDRLGPRLRNGTVTVSSDKSRSQWRNRQLARSQLAEIVAEGLRPAPPPRRSTKPSRAAKRRRLESKRARSRIKQLRRRPDVD